MIWVTALHEYVEQTSDLDFAYEMLPVMERILAFFEKHKRDGLIENPQDYWGFYEWAPYLDGTAGHYDNYIARDGFDAPLNAFYMMALQAAEEIYKLQGAEHQAYLLAENQRLLKRRYREVFWSQQYQAFRLSTAEGCVEIYPQLVQALSVYARFCENADDEILLTERLFSNEFWPEATLSHSIYLYQAAVKNPAVHMAALNDMEEKWGKMLFEGATSFWETKHGASDFENAGSLCHGWSAVPIWMYLVSGIVT